MTGADLPNAFPYFIAIERLVSADLTPFTAVLVLVAYAVVYCLPCLALLAVGINQGKRVTDALRRLHDRFGSEATVPASRKKAMGFFLAALGVAAIASSA
jgi:hypothetical protein